MEPLSGTCLSCGIQALTKCSKCKQAFYCGRACQKIDWRSHKKGHDEPLDTFGIGQFINDACKPQVQTMDFSSTLEALTRYQMESTHKSNCEVGPDNWFIATRDIETNQELFTHYGFEFWAQKFMLDSASPVERLLFYAVMDQNRKPFDLRRFYNFTDATMRSFLKVLIQVPDVEQENFDPKKYICQVTDQINIQAPVEIQS
ncbi:uncharacterized protein LOC131885494 [Tigriopus californicus]|uniref:uncharacterized protein LOC131885494 n=1 Tax=Tigriopus californicus TaxID=6832 RepID=UPI0027DA1384|nr:uncharacterized protein LOC131885494 [Tigriopus californicus]